MQSNNGKKFEFEIPVKAISQNWYVNKHWTVQRKIKEEFHLSVLEAKQKYKLQHITAYPVFFWYEFHVSDKRAHDLDNYAITIKFIQDGLRHCGILEEDTIDHIDNIKMTGVRSDVDKIVVRLI